MLARVYTFCPKCAVQDVGLFLWSPGNQGHEFRHAKPVQYKTKHYDSLTDQPAVKCSFSPFHSVGESTPNNYWSNATICPIFHVWRQPSVSVTDSSKTHKTVTPLDIHRNTNCQASGQKTHGYEGQVCLVKSDIAVFFLAYLLFHANSHWTVQFCNMFLLPR